MRRFMKPLEEPLLESAPIAWQIAPQLCRRNSATGLSCSPVHGIWQYLRILGLVTTPRDHSAFLQNALGAAISPAKQSSVLIPGAMDYSMLACVFSAFDPQATLADVT